MKPEVLPSKQNMKTQIISLFNIDLIADFVFVAVLQEENPEPCDKKQKHDLGMSGLIPWLLSVSIVIIYFLIDNGKVGEISKMVYLPLYLFATLLIFSISVLRNFKKS